ncbi:MAG: DsbA family protein [Candidatus Rokubacteria bacterium]|nr:DsbA family protein [Candidatus Rokubacteria bacterium]
MRLRKLSDEYRGRVIVESRAFPLRPSPEAGVPWKGTYREQGWQRCAAMSAGDGIVFTPWPHDALPGWSLPALEAAKCVVKQAPDLFDRVHLALYRAFFTESRNIGDPAEVIRIVGDAAPLDMTVFVADYRAGIGRQGVATDWEAAAEHHVTSIPTVIVPATGRALVGLADLSTYRAVMEEALAA